MRKKKIKALVWGIDNPRKIAVGEANVANIVRVGDYPQPVEYRIYEHGKQRPRIIDGLRVDKIEYFET
jgi:hypothetical protein